jgi:hypothetical protein
VNIVSFLNTLRQPFHFSETERTGRFLDLIHSDIYGPIPVVPR